MPIVTKTICNDLQNHFKSKYNNESIVRIYQDFSQLRSLLNIVNAQEDGVDHNSSHNEIFKGLRLNNFEALQTKAVDWFNRDNLGIGVH